MASYGVILCFELGNKKVCLKVAVVNGEVPLLVSRLALGKMGMIMDVEYNRASFRSLGVTDMTLQITQTGHPAFSVQPACIPRSCLAASNWESAEIQILPLSGQYIEVTEGKLSSEKGSLVQMCDSCSLGCATSWMVSSEDVVDVQAGDGISDERLQCSEPEFKPVFYPKKIGLAAKNLFLDEVFNPQTFASWWSATKISNDFWVESEELLVRVHVIPRRSFFSPTHWRTADFARKHSLLQSLGAVRTVHAISCKSFREFPVTHGTWDDESDDSCLPVLWVGRTLFRRRKQMPIPTSLPSTSRDGPQVGPADSAHGVSSEDFVGVHQGRAGGGSPSTQFVVSRELDGPGDQVFDPRGQAQPQRESPRGQRNEQDDDPAVEGTSYGARLPPPDVCHQGNDYEDPTRPARHGSSEHPRLRQVQREDVQRDAGELQELGVEGGRIARQPFGRPGDVRELVARRTSSMEGDSGSRSEIFGGDRLHRPRDEREDPLHRGRQFNDVMGLDLERESRFSLSRSQGEESALVHHASTSDPAEEKDDGEHRDGRGHPHGPGDPRGGGRRSEVLGGETGCAEGSAWNPSDPELNATKEDAHEELYYDCEDPYNVEATYNADGAEETQDFPLDYANREDQEGSADHNHNDSADEEEQSGHDEINDYLGEFNHDYIDKDEVFHGQEQDYPEGNGYVYDMNHGGNGDVFQCQTSEVKRASTLEQCENLAKSKMKEKAFSFEDALEVARALPLRRLRRGKSVQRGGGSCFDYFVGGLYTYGPFVGLTRSAKGLPWTIKFFNSFVRSLGGGQWTSFVLFRNTATERHTDNHNLSGTMIKTVTFGNFSGGELWVQGPVPQGENHQIAYRKGSDGKDIAGYLVDTREKLYQFSGKIPHATQPWEGERWTLSCYTTRGYPQSTIALRDELRELRFPLRGVPLHDRGQDATWEVPNNPRPNKSTRKSLWKKAGRIAALTAWCTAAATACVSDDFPIHRGREAVALFEIGGYQKTLEITEIDYLVAEPFGYELDREVQWNPEVVHQTVRDLLPAVLWVHVPEATNLLPSILNYLYEQVDHGRQLVLEAPPEHPCWNTQAVKELFERYIQKWRRRRSEPHLLRVNDFTDYGYDREPKSEITEFDNYMVRHQTGGEEDDKDVPDKVGAEAITFEGGAKIASEVKSSLRRLHQNLGHPNNTDLARHLRLAGADPSVIEATKKIKCQVCHRNQRGQSSKPASLPNVLDFNQVVAVDAFYVYDTLGTKVELMMAIDVGTGFISAGRLLGHSTETMEASFCTIWSNTFGAPGTLVVDLESGLQSGLGRFSEWHGTRIRPIAGQAHWQNGAVERAIRTWKEIWVKVIDEYSATSDEADMVVTAANAAMNTLRRDAGFSPAQAVWGRNPQLPDEARNNAQDEHVEHIISVDKVRAREHSIRTAAKEAYFRCQNEARIRKGLLQRSRVAGPELQVGTHVFFYRKPKNNRNWAWHGPGVVIGREGPNSWISFAGRCHLVAPEHTRLASGEELGEAFSLRATQDDLHRLLAHDFGDEELYDQGDVEMEPDPALPPGDEGQDDGLVRGEGSRRKQNELPEPPVTKRFRVKGPPPSTTQEATHEVNMLKIAKTARGKEKALEKEIPWSLIPPEQHASFREAERKQWLEHANHGALEPLTISESREVTKHKPGRILGSRFAYRDKLWSRRRAQPDVGWKPKARLVIAGHRDPDLAAGLATHAPTISRQGIHLLLQILASNLSNGWRGFAGDVTAAFLCGEDLSRELYLRQPRTGLGDLHPEQLLRIRKPIFGLVDSPAAWWHKFQKVVKKLEISSDASVWTVVQSSLDHCIFMVQRVAGKDENQNVILDPPSAYLGVHVDDVLLVGEGGLCELVKRELSKQFPIQDWEADKFDYVGSYIEIASDYVKVSQASYATTRLFEVETNREDPDTSRRPRSKSTTINPSSGLCRGWHVRRGRTYKSACR